MEIQFSKRTNLIKEYYFSKKLEEVHSLKQQGMDIISLGIGSPDLMPSDDTLLSTIEAIKGKSSHQYQSYRSIIELRKGFAEFYKNYYNIELNAEEEVLPLIGSKEGIFFISMAMLNEGDEVLVPNPGYPSYSNATKLAGGLPVFFNLYEDNDWYPNIKELESLVTDKTRLMWINYPNMPTGATFNAKRVSLIVDFCKANNIVLCHDNPYSMILSENMESIFSIDTKKECCLELNSMSKSFNMPGWRIGVLIANKLIVDNVLKVKSNVDSGMFLPLQTGAISALNNSKEWHKERNKIYSERRDIIFQLLDNIEFQHNKNAVGMFVWAKISNKYRNADEACNDILYNAGVFITPGNVFGSNGDNYVRLSLCCEKDRIIEARDRIDKLFNNK
ncbi:MAG: aminotransferase [Bacteroidetes bacterium GWE2_29_8]|nr:MAG: aminotransferase [Bacteroidetes bacterium GWE2_29_8]